MRGKVGLLLLLRSRSWITPAYAGKSFIVRCSALEVKDHPRICGEKFNALPAELKAKGSPPHMRGKVGLKETQSSASRITPAYAGKSFDSCLCHPDITWITPAYAGKSTRISKESNVSGDHPRICGEKSRKVSRNTAGLGSPPHMRGKVFGSGCVFNIRRITPAYAGKRLRVSCVHPVAWDHPRICGEKIDGVDRLDGGLGSPPHMRGKASFSLMRPPGDEDHPRICGEKDCSAGLIAPGLGSPPHMRGKDDVAIHAAVEARITPAYAGKSSAQLPQERLFWDHPRICGEKMKSK